MESGNALSCRFRAARRTGRIGLLPRLIGVLVVAGVGPFASVARAELQGDLEVLKMAAVKYRTNLDLLENWRGRLAMSSQFLRKEGNHLVECNIEFAYDKKTSSNRWTIHVNKDVKTAGGKEEPAEMPHRRAGLIRDGVHYQFMYDLGKEASPHTVTVGAKRFFEPGFHMGSFEPAYFLTHEGQDFDKYWLFLCENAKQPAIVGSLVRKGDRLMLINERAKQGLRSVCEINLAQGGNVERLETSLKRPELERTTAWTWTWEQVNGVWVPKEIRKDFVTTGEKPEEYHDRLTWTENAVNTPLAEDEFSLVKLGVRRDDVVYDTRTGSRYKIQGKEYPAPPGKEPPAEPPAEPAPGFRGSRLLIAAVSLLLLVVGAGYLFRHARVRRPQ